MSRTQLGEKKIKKLWMPKIEGKTKRIIELLETMWFHKCVNSLPWADLGH